MAVLRSVPFFPLLFKFAFIKDSWNLNCPFSYICYKIFVVACFVATFCNFNTYIILKRYFYLDFFLIFYLLRKYTYFVVLIMNYVYDKNINY